MRLASRIRIRPELTSPGIRLKLNRMRTTLDLPEDLIRDAQQALGFKSKTDTVVYALHEVVRRQKLKELAGMIGHLGLDIDLDKVRRRPKK